MEALNELVDFLKPETRLDVKTLALHHVLSMTGNFESRKMIIQHPKAVSYVIILAFKKDEQKSIVKDAFFTLINLSADEIDAGVLLQKNPLLLRLVLDYILDENSKFADTACAILSNLSRGRRNSEIIFNSAFQQSVAANDSNNNTAQEKARSAKSAVSFEKLLQVFCTENFNKTNTLDYLAPFICNLTQLDTVRNTILNDSLLLLRLLPFTTYQRSMIRRGGIMGSIKNLCFNYGKISD
jgi:hypothetical protein